MNGALELRPEVVWLVVERSAGSDHAFASFNSIIEYLHMTSHITWTRLGGRMSRASGSFAGRLGNLKVAGLSRELVGSIPG